MRLDFVDDMVKQEIHGLESIIASDLPFSVKNEAMQKYEAVLAETGGVTLALLEDVKNVLGRKGLTEKKRVAELKALEDTFIGGARKTHSEIGRPFNETAWRGQFRAYANNVYRMRHQRIMRIRQLKFLRAQRKAERAAGKRPVPFRRKPK